MAKVHILTQYVWPDAAPTGLYAEQLAVRLRSEGHDVRLVGGQGGYRSLERPKPQVELVHLEHRQGRRGDLLQTFAEYAFVTRAFKNYIAQVVAVDDVVVVSSAPPNTVALAKAIRRRGARAVYWLQDYYPELIRGLHEYPTPLRGTFRYFWDRYLAKWDRVVKIGANLGGPKHNAVVIRNWPTIEFDRAIQPEPKTALYLGNFGYGHDVRLFVDACEALRARNYEISIRADGRGVRLLPAWLRVKPVCRDVAESRAELLRHEVHLIAADPRITQAIFPSKIWNSLAAGRQLVCTGFRGEMALELEASKSALYESHLDDWVALIAEAHRAPMPASDLRRRAAMGANRQLQPAVLK